MLINIFRIFFTINIKNKKKKERDKIKPENRIKQMIIEREIRRKEIVSGSINLRDSFWCPIVGRLEETK